MRNHNTHHLLLNGDTDDTAPVAFHPTDFSGLWAWYDAAEIPTVRTGTGDTAASGDAVAVWQDRSGGDRHLHDIGASFRPLLLTESGVRRVAFDPAGLHLWLVYAAPEPLPQPVTIFLVGAFNTLTDGAALFDGSSDTMSVFCGSGGGSLSSFAGAGGLAIAGLDTSRLLVTAVFDGVSSSLRLNNAAPVAGNTGTNRLPGLRLGGDVSGGVAGRLDGYLCEFIVVSGTVSAENQVACRAYLSAKWM